VIYIAKATENFGLPMMHPIYECALEVLPNHQMAQMCLQFTALECKLGEIPLKLKQGVCNNWFPHSPDMAPKCRLGLSM